MIIRLELPPPDAKLHAHNSGHWRSKAGAVKALRELAALVAHQHRIGPTWERAGITYRFFFGDNRQRDAANCVQSMKPAVDGVVDAGLIAGDNWQRLQIDGVFCEIDRERPRTVLEIREIV